MLAEEGEELDRPRRGRPARRVPTRASSGASDGSLARPLALRHGLGEREQPLHARRQAAAVDGDPVRGDSAATLIEEGQQGAVPAAEPLRLERDPRAAAAAVSPAPPRSTRHAARITHSPARAICNVSAPDG